MGRPNHPELVKLWVHIGSIALASRRYPEAERCYGRALEALKGVPQTRSDELQVLNQIAVTLRRTGRHAAALPYSERALAARGESARSGTPYYGDIDGQCRVAKIALSGLEEAESLYLKALAITEKAFGADHRCHGELLCDYSVVLKKMKRMAEADRAAERGRAILSAIQTRRDTVDVSDFRRDAGNR